MESEYQSFTEDAENQPPPSYSVKVGNLGRVELYDEEQNCTRQAETERQSHYVDGDEDDLSSIDEAFDVLSITSSIDDRLT